MGAVTQTLTGTYNFATNQPPTAFFDCGASGRTVVLPSILNGVGIDGRVHQIINVGAANSITLNAHADDGSATVATIPPGGQAYAVASFVKGTWYVIVEGTTSAALIGSATKQTIILPLQLPDILGTSQFSIGMPFSFTVNSALFKTARPATTAAKLATLTVQVNGVSVTGGVMNLTSANQTPANASVAASAITAGGTGAAGTSIGVIASAVTAFVEGDGWVEFTVTNNDLLNVLQ